MFNVYIFRKVRAVQPLFSIVIPTYNRSRPLMRAVQSVMAQSLADFEVIVVDDGSSDDTEAAICAFSDPLIRYIRQSNGGGSKARNTGIDAARGRYIAFLDSDDVFLPSHLANSSAALNGRNSICVYSQVIVDRGGGLSFIKPSRSLRETEHISEYLMCDRGFVPTITLVVPVEMARLVRYDETLSSGQDTDFAIRLRDAGANFEMILAPGAVWDDRVSNARLSSKGDAVQRTEWLHRLGTMITKRALFADLGWTVAKAHVRRGRYMKALAHYGRALCYGCYSPKLALVVILQVFLHPSTYRKLSDNLARRGVQP